MKRTRLLLPFFLLTLLLAACGQTPPPTEEPDPPASTAPAAPAPEAPPEPSGTPDAGEPPVSAEESVLPASGAAASIREQLQQGGDAGEWLPLLADISWGDLYVPGEETDWIMEAQMAVAGYVETQDAGLTEEECRILLSCTKGLDGAYAEGYAGILYSLYIRNPTRFAAITLDELSPEQRDETAGLLLYSWGYYRQLDESLPYEERLAVLLSRLEEDKRGGLLVSPDAVYLWYEGQSFPLTLVNAAGIYAVSYESSDPAVAAVDGLTGTVTAVGPGQAVITLHYEGDGGPQDFTCSVTCAW